MVGLVSQPAAILLAQYGQIVTNRCFLVGGEQSKHDCPPLIIPFVQKPYRQLTQLSIFDSFKI